MLVHDVVFTGLVEAGGYRVEGDWIVAADPGRAERESAREVHPMDDSPGLLREFLALRDAADVAGAVEDWANRRGLLGKWDTPTDVVPEGSPRREPLSGWLETMQELSTAVDLWNALVGSDKPGVLDGVARLPTWALEQFRVSLDPLLRVADSDAGGDASGKRVIADATTSPDQLLTIGLVAVASLVSMGSRFAMSPMLVKRDNGWSLKLCTVARSLCAVLWWEFAEQLDFESEIRICVECGNQFKLKLARGVWAKKKFCSDACKSADYRRRRSAREFSAAGLDAGDVARQISDERRAIGAEEVEGWLRARRV